jgi:hypothetical protein
MYDIIYAAETRQIFYEHAVGTLSREDFLLFDAFRVRKSQSLGKSHLLVF